MKEKPNFDSQFLEAFLSDRIPKAKKDTIYYTIYYIIYYFLIHSSNSCELYQRIPGNVLKLLSVRVLESFIFTNPDGIPEHKVLSPAW